MSFASSPEPATSSVISLLPVFSFLLAFPGLSWVAFSQLHTDFTSLCGGRLTRAWRKSPTLRFGTCSWFSAEGCFFLFRPLSFASLARAAPAVVRGAGKGASAGRATAGGQGCACGGRRTQGQPEKRGCARNASSPCRAPLPALGGRLHVPPGSSASPASPRRDGGTPRRPENPPRARAPSVGAAGLAAARSPLRDGVPGADPALPWGAVRSSGSRCETQSVPQPVSSGGRPSDRPAAGGEERRIWGTAASSARSPLPRQILSPLLAFSSPAPLVNPCSCFVPRCLACSSGDTASEGCPTWRACAAGSPQCCSRSVPCGSRRVSPGQRRQRSFTAAGKSEPFQYRNVTRRRGGVCHHATAKREFISGVPSCGTGCVTLSLRT